MLKGSEYFYIEHGVWNRNSNFGNFRSLTENEILVTFNKFRSIVDI